MFRFTPYALSPLVGFLVLAALSWLVVSRRKAGGPHLAFALLNLSTAAWILDIFLLSIVRDPAAAHLVDRLFQPIIVSIPLAWVNFTTAFLGSRSRKIVVRIFLAWTLVLVVLSTTRLFLRGTVAMYFGYYGAAGPLYILYVITYLAALILIVTLLAREYRRTRDAVTRNQVGYFLLASVIMGVFSADNFLPLYGVEKYPLGSIAVILYLVVVGLAVIRYRFMDLRTAIKKSLIYSIATFVLTAFYLGVILFLEELVRAYLLPESFFIPLLPALAAAFMFQGVKERVQTRLDDVFGHEKKRTAIISSFTRAARSVTDRRELALLFRRKMEAALGVERLAFFTREQGSGRWRTELDGGLGGEGIAFLLDEFLPRTIGEGREILDLRDPGFAGAAAVPGMERLAELGFHLVVPLKGRDLLAGACLLGPQASGGRFTAQDRSFIGALSGHVAASLEVREYYDRWRREEKFTSLGRASATISHELRNPLNIIRGAVAYLQSRARGEEVARFTDIIVQEVDKTSRFIDQFLKASRVPPIHPVPLDAGEWTRCFAAGWALRHPGIVLDVGLPAGPVPARLDPFLMEQLLENLLGNAAEAMEQHGCVTLSLEAGKDGRKPGARDLVFTVSDQGPGIPEEKREAVFDPFFTTKAGGTGLGLCVVDGVVRAHGGRIEQDAPSGGGARFKVVLPDFPGGPQSGTTSGRSGRKEEP